MNYPNREDFEKVNIFGTGDPNTAYAKYFIGESFLAQLQTENNCPVHLCNVSFEPGCRNNCIHTASSGGGQILLCIAGEGWYQEEGKSPVNLVPGVTVYIPTGVKHWHGAKADSWFSHISIEIPGENCGTSWLEPVLDDVYQQL